MSGPMLIPTRRAGIGSHTTPNGGATDDWYTPPEILKALGPFDLDPCAGLNMPWTTAARMLTIEDDGLAQPWEGRVWLNPPYGSQTGTWLERLAAHGSGTALVFARTETAMFHQWVWPKATALLFIKGRLFFHTADGSPAKSNAGGPSVLIAYGRADADRLKGSGIAGAFLLLSTRECGQLCEGNGGTETANTSATTNGGGL